MDIILPSIEDGNIFLSFGYMRISLEGNNTLDVKKFLFNCIDLTTLKETDNDEAFAKELASLGMHNYMGL